VTGGEKIAAFARAHAPAACHSNLALYLDAVAPDVDHVPPGSSYFTPHPPSTCALFASRCLSKGAGLVDREITEDYTHEIGTAVANVQVVAMRRKAWILGTPSEPFQIGDIPIIDGPPYGVHVIVCVEDCTVGPDGSWRGQTVQGGQGDGGVQAFASSWQWRGRELYAGTSQRHVIGFVRASLLGCDDAITGAVSVAPATP
jgi:hypothetical protein